jgi:hypothetical protein
MSCAAPAQRGDDRRVPGHEHTGRGQDRLEEDLDRASGEAGIGHGHSALLADGFAVRNDAQEERLLGLHGLQRVEPHGVLRAVAAYEALDRPVRVHEPDAPRLHAGRSLHAHDRRHDERLTLRGELLGPA